MQQTIKQILVPVDFERSSDHALDMAIALAQAFGADLTLLHVWEIPVYPYMEFVLSSNELVTSVERAAQQRLDETLTEVKARLPNTRATLRMGLPWQEIVDVIKTEKPDLVVMGTHGRRGLTHALLGSVAEKVVRLSPAPVLTAHAPEPS